MANHLIQFERRHHQQKVARGAMAIFDDVDVRASEVLDNILDINSQSADVFYFLQQV
ncbi:hypothetical protein CGRA01v4_05701 [Colletotrichum graminicola]|nr:hypothetical protein CGRA01v4_05701 [Colletotrichum graminicola]